MKTPQPLATAIVVTPAAELAVMITCPGGSSNQVATSEHTGIKNIVFGFLKAIGATGSWNVQVRTNGGALKRKNLQAGSLKVTGRASGPQQTSASIVTPEGQKRDLIMVGPLMADDVIRRSEQYPNRTYTLKEPGEPRKDVIVNLPTVIKSEDVILFLYTITQDGGTILTKDASQLAEGLGGEDLIYHCLEEGLLQKDGSAAYTVTPEGTAVVPPAIEPDPTTNQPANITEIVEQVADARRTLELRKEIEAKVLSLTQTRDTCEREYASCEQKRAGLQRQIETLTKTMEENCEEILRTEIELRTKTEELHSRKFGKAAQVIEDARALQDLLK
jgi:flagellar motility protein MotE (MotC chaperone)